MDTIRLKAKLGDDEFDLEGPAEFVREQYRDWQELVKMKMTAMASMAAPTASAPPRQGAATEVVDDGQAFAPANKPDANSIDSALTKVMRVEHRTVSLTARLSNVQDAILVMLYGQKVLRSNESVTGAELLSGLAATGGFPVPRLDRVLDKLAESGEIMSFGERRGKKYRLTNTGMAKARQIAGDLIATVA